MGGQPKEHTVRTTQQQETAGTQHGTTTGATAGGATQQVDIPTWLQPFVQGGFGTAGSALNNFQNAVNMFELPAGSMEQLQNTAEGQYLYGGEAQDAFTQAAQRAALPGIISQFGGAGRTGGLAQHAVAQSGIDAYANLYNQERNRQLQAQQLLPQLMQLPIELQQRLATTAATLPGLAAPFLGQTGATFGTTSGETSGETTGTMSGTGTETTPIYNPPWWQTALGGLGTLGGLAFPGFGGVSALGNIAGGLGFGANAFTPEYGGAPGQRGGLLGSWL